LNFTRRNSIDNCSVKNVDPRVLKHAKILVNYSTKVGKGDNVLIQISDHGKDLAIEIYKQAAVLGASPLIVTLPDEAIRGYYTLTPEEYLKIFPKHYYALVKASDVIISIRSSETTRYLSNVDPKRISTRNLTIKKISDERLRKRWCLTQYPTPAFAQEAGISLREYEDFVYSAVLRDWDKETKKMRKLKKKMNNANQLQIIGEDTDLTLSIKGRTACISKGVNNLPGGEVFTAPVDNSANGKVFFDLPALAYGKEVLDIRLTFENGKIIDYSAGKNEELLEAMINTDEGSKRLGELGIGTNRGITKFTRNTLFDEKIAGTIHLAIGRSYEECGGVNESAIHWDMIKTMRTGKIIIDGEVIHEDGKFKWEK
jgi:aminopeptidase